MPPLNDPQAEQLRHIHNIPALVKYLDEELGWPIAADDWEDAVFDWKPEELNLKPEHQVAIRSIKQLRPLVSNQPWGVFFVDFDKRELPIVVLRRVLNGLAIKRRVKGSGHQTWTARDLLFVSSFGEGTPSNPREMALAHFTDESDIGDLPTLRVLGWDEEDTGLQLSYVAKTLKEKLRWPALTTSKAEQDAWRVQWAAAFSLQYRQVINDSKTLALALAELAKRIRSRVNTVLALESDSGHLRQLHKAFKDNLISDLTEDGFADMYAQTITYGLFAARASRGSGALVADDAVLMAPSTNPFLRELLQDFLHAGGRAQRTAKRVDFDELGINEVVTTLRDVPMDDVLRSFNAAKPGDDPVIHFYEDFLKAYDKKMRAKRGVFYTPRPVVQFIVRNVDEILKSEFGIEDGLASTITWGEMMQRKPELKLPKHCTHDTPFVQVLDPATGTGTFIVEVIEHIHTHMVTKWRKQGLVTKAQWQPLWNDYVQKHLLPRLYAFELMMAPYAIAHMKIGLKLGETGYTFPDDGPRVNVFLTNALEPAHAVNPGLEFDAPMLAHEASAANRVKEQLAATVVIGNPPYSGVSNNMFPWIDGLLKGQLPDGTVVKSYYQVDGKPLGEKKLWLQDDYVKFIRYGQWRIEMSGTGVMGYITNHGYLDNPTFRGMRQCLANCFNAITILDLHGYVNKKERAPDGTKDDNVFDIAQGVAIGLMRAGGSRKEKLHASLLGGRQQKYETLNIQTATGVNFQELQLRSPYYFFNQVDESNREEYNLYWPMPSIAPVNSTGIATARDHFVIDFEKSSLLRRISDFCSSQITDDEIRSRYFHGRGAERYLDGDTRGWKISDVRKHVTERELSESIELVYYRPFDLRFAILSVKMIDWGRTVFMRHITAHDNLILLGSKLAKAEPYGHCLVTRNVPEVISLSPTTSNNAYAFPLWLYDDGNKRANISLNFAHALALALEAPPTSHDLQRKGAVLHAERVYYYIYAVLHCPTYRQSYAAFLRTDFPRIPIPGSLGVFDELAALGEQLVQWHLLEHPDALAIGYSPDTSPLPAGEEKIPAGEREIPAWFGTDFTLQKVAEKGRTLAEAAPSTGPAQTGVVGKVFINATSGFENVNQPVWKHTIGGYQVLHKWLADRRKAGRSLSQDDITHWLRVYASLEATQALMLQIDEAIDAHGGWPGAFSQNHPPPDAAMLAAEQLAQKAQLKAQKKATAAGKKSTVGLFDDLR